MTAQSQPLFSQSTSQPKPAPTRSHGILTAALGCVFAMTAMTTMTGCKTSPPPIGLEGAKNFNLNKFSGEWHEIARSNIKEENGLTQVSTKFTRMQDGNWLITSRAWNTAKGRWVGSQKVSKKPPFYAHTSFMLGFWQPRHVVIIDNDHTLAVVCGKNYRQFWILSKNPEPEQSRLDTILALAEAAGFPVKEAFYVPTR